MTWPSWPAGTLAILLVASASAQERVRGIDFLNERLPIPDSELFDEGAYIESGVGLSFGVDKRLTYLAGQYAEAVERFELAARAFRYKAEIWVYLARAYFYTKSPEEAKRALERGVAVMPDLAERLWQPLLASLVWEIRQRAGQQQTRVDFYEPDQEEFHSLFRLYLFLEDYAKARGVVGSARARSRAMRERASMVSADSRRAQVAQAGRWDDLAQTLTLELQSLQVEPPAADSGATSLSSEAAAEVPPTAMDDEERLRLLQLRIDFYRAAPADFRALFEGYLARGETDKARAVITALGRSLQDLDLRAEVAPTATDEAKAREEWEQLRQLRADLQQQLPATAPATGSAGSQP